MCKCWFLARCRPELLSSQTLCIEWAADWAMSWLGTRWLIGAAEQVWSGRQASRSSRGDRVQGEVGGNRDIQVDRHWQKRKKQTVQTNNKTVTELFVLWHSRAYCNSSCLLLLLGSPNREPVDHIYVIVIYTYIYMTTSQSPMSKYLNYPFKHDGVQCIVWLTCNLLLSIWTRSTFQPCQKCIYAYMCSWALQVFLCKVCVWTCAGQWE